MDSREVYKGALSKNEFMTRLNLKEIKDDAESSIRLAIFEAARAQEQWAIDEKYF